MSPDMPTSIGLGFLTWKTGKNWEPSMLPVSFASSCNSTGTGTTFMCEGKRRDSRLGLLVSPSLAGRQKSKQATLHSPPAVQSRSQQQSAQHTAQQDTAVHMNMLAARQHTPVTLAFEESKSRSEGYFTETSETPLPPARGECDRETRAAHVPLPASAAGQCHVY